MTSRAGEWARPTRCFSSWTTNEVRACFDVETGFESGPAKRRPVRIGLACDDRETLSASAITNTRLRKSGGVTHDGDSTSSRRVR